MIIRKQRYNIFGDYYTIKYKDIFYYALVGDLEKIKEMIDDDKYLLNEKDELGRNLLYISARNGYYDLTKYLIEKGININETQCDGSTPLHGAAYYGQLLISKLLLDHGALTNIRNNFGNLAFDEASNNLIKINILNCQQDPILNLYKKLFLNNLATNLILIEKNNIIIAKKILCSINLSQIKNNKDWINVWHGTKFENLESIAQNGLRRSDTELPNGMMIKPQPNHIPLDQVFEGNENWAKAIFVSPSLFYASDQSYAERIFSNGRCWATLIEAKIKPNSYSCHKTTLLRNLIDGEPSEVEFRIQSILINDGIIYRISSKDNVIINSLTFVSVEFLDNANNYNEGEILVNSKEEKDLLDFY